MKQLELTKEETDALAILVNGHLWDATKLVKKYADTMNSIYFKLTNRNHHEWQRRPENKNRHKAKGAS